ncbi:MAG: type II secretion system protein [Longimicrobiales bacterium]
MRDGGAARRGAGFTLAEILVAILLSYLVMALALGMVARQREVVRLLGDRAERLAATRTARHVLGQEARAAAGEGAWAVGPDSLALRAFRGHGLVCPGGVGSAEIHVAAAGTRAPDPAKDSVLLVLASGRTAVLALVERGPSNAPCPFGSASPERWLLSGTVPRDVVVAGWFERGAYHLSAGALRYRRGLAGRQPLTPEVLMTPGSGFRAVPPDVVADLVLDGGVGPVPAWAFRLRGVRDE